MKRPLISLFIVLWLVTGCAYFQKKDEPPPLPDIVETKPPLTLKGEYFKAFPWTALDKPRKDGNDPDTTTYTVNKDGETLASIAEKTMGDPGLAPELATYNGISSSKVSVGDTIVIPNPIIGMSNQIMVKAKGEKEFGPPQSFVDTQFKKGDQYKFKFESNVYGYCYIFRQGAKKVEFLYPAQVKVQPNAAQLKARQKKGQKKAKTPPPPTLMWEPGKVKAHDPFEVPIGKKGFVYDPTGAGDVVFVFLSLREIPDLESLKETAKITVEDLEGVMHRVKEPVYSEGPYRLLRINVPSEILGYKLNLKG